MKNLNLIALKGLRAVEAVARQGSLAGAAAELGVTSGAVSQQIAKAEAALGRTFFERTPGGLVPRAEALGFLDALGEGFGRIDAALGRLARDRDSAVTLSVAPIFASRWLIWRLPEFYRAHPGITVLLDPETRLVDPLREDVDFGIRIGAGTWRGVEAEKLFDQLILPVCAPALAERMRSPEDLAEMPIIRDSHAMFGWDDWLAPLGLSAAILGPGPSFPEASLCLDAAIAGMGVFLAFETLARDTLARGPLVAPFPQPRRTAHHYALITAPGRSMTPAARTFARWLKARIAEEGLGDPARW